MENQVILGYYLNLFNKEGKAFVEKPLELRFIPEKPIPVKEIPDELNLKKTTTKSFQKQQSQFNCSIAYPCV